ncbi:MAG: ABC transporter ATP-binding protein [Armatimonadetes bacterium]|nr:ABC transporter ATP-binding protein [Armatimonadota bacterium]
MTVPPEPILSVKSVTKRYRSVAALQDVSADFYPGEVHAVLGENGAGKSTLMGILAGFVVPDSGTVTLNGGPAPIGRPFQARDDGIQMVHQHFMLVPNFTVEENLALSGMRGLWQTLDTKALSKNALSRAIDLGWKVDADERTGSLPVGVQQRLEILKGVADRALVLILDEPTAVLSPSEVNDLFRVLRELKEQNIAIILIAHKLSEVMAIADRVTVLRRGKWVASCRIEETNAEQLEHWMVGEVPHREAAVSTSSGETLLDVQSIDVLGDRGNLAVKQAQFQVASGEILGIGGVDGNGQIELAEALVGVREVAQGDIQRPDATGYIPQDRHQDGLALGLSIEENTLLSHVPQDAENGPMLMRSKVRRWASDIVDRFRVKIGEITDPVASLSGGNQQKVIVGRVLSQNPKLIVAVNPTRGLDIRAANDVHERLRDAAKAGAAVVLFSADLDELALLSTRQLAISRGELGTDYFGSIEAPA